MSNNLIVDGQMLLKTTSALNGSFGFEVYDNRGLFVRNDSSATGLPCYFENYLGGQVGYISTSTTATAYLTSSDHRLKENIVDINDGITRLKQLQPRRFNFKIDPSTTVDGFVAHEVTAVPEAIQGEHNEVDGDGNPVYQAIDQAKLVPLLQHCKKQ